MGHIAFYVRGKSKRRVTAKKAKRERHTDAQKDALMPLMEQAQ